MIEVGDDGGGLKRAKILAKAIERGLVEPGRVLSDSEIYGLIFEPGFSTAELSPTCPAVGSAWTSSSATSRPCAAASTSHSEDGVGTTVTVRLPLTLAIIDGFQVDIGESVFVIPLDMVDECVEFSAESGHDYTDLRGEVLPFIRLREVFEVEGAATRRESIVRASWRPEGGLVVDTLLGELQTVIKPLGKMFSQVRCISGSTILGSGEVALILDVAALFNKLEGRDLQQMAA